MPVLFVWNGDHFDYHEPSDTSDRINVTGMRRVVNMSEEAITTLTKMERPAFVQVQGARIRMTGGPRLGVRPTYSSDKEGMEVGGVIPGEAAEKAGIKQGDVIINIGGKTVKNIGSYMQAMSTQKKGVAFDVIVLRKGEKVTLKAKLEE